MHILFTGNLYFLNKQLLKLLIQLLPQLLIKIYEFERIFFSFIVIFSTLCIIFVYTQHIIYLLHIICYYFYILFIYYSIRNLKIACLIMHVKRRRKNIPIYFVLSIIYSFYTKLFYENEYNFLTHRIYYRMSFRQL